MKKNLPPSKDKYWEDAEKQRIEVTPATPPQKWVRQGRYAVSVDTPYELSVAIDFEKFDIVDGMIVVKSK